MIWVLVDWGPVFVFVFLLLVLGFPGRFGAGGFCLVCLVLCGAGGISCDWGRLESMFVLKCLRSICNFESHCSLSETNEDRY